MLTLLIAMFVTVTCNSRRRYMWFDHVVRLSKFGMLIIMLLNYCVVPCPVANLSILIWKSSARIKQNVIGAAFKHL